MIIVNADQFAQAFGITSRASQIAFKNAAVGKTWRGETLSVVQIPGRQGGSSGSVWALKPEACSPDIRASLTNKPSA